MDWTAFSLSLQLAAWTVTLLLPIAILLRACSPGAASR